MDPAQGCHYMYEPRRAYETEHFDGRQTSDFISHTIRPNQQIQIHAC